MSGVPNSEQEETKPNAEQLIHINLKVKDQVNMTDPAVPELSIEEELDGLKTIPDPMQTYRANVFKEAQKKTTELTNDIAILKFFYNEYNDETKALEKERDDWDEYLKVIQGLAESSSKIVMSSFQSFEPVELLSDLISKES